MDFPGSVGAVDGVKALESALSAATAWILDEADTVRKSVVQGVHKAERVIRRAPWTFRGLWARWTESRL